MTSLFADPSRGADLSECERYRYLLWRRWDPATSPVLFVMLNPSGADALVDDPTIRRCIGFARAWGAGGIHVVNLYPWRATDPADLPTGPEVAGEDDGRRNDEAILSAADAAGRIIVAWGTKPGPHASTSAHVLALLDARPVEALKVAKHGQPWHPLYVRGDVVPVPYTGSPMA